jgi:hypothetical protein
MTSNNKIEIAKTPAAPIKAQAFGAADGVLAISILLLDVILRLWSLQKSNLRWLRESTTHQFPNKNEISGLVKK